mgnify:CR=1 FL=1
MKFATIGDSESIRMLRAALSIEQRAVMIIACAIEWESARRSGPQDRLSAVEAALEEAVNPKARDMG